MLLNILQYIDKHVAYNMLGHSDNNYDMPHGNCWYEVLLQTSHLAVEPTGGKSTFSRTYSANFTATSDVDVFDVMSTANASGTSFEGRSGKLVIQKNNFNQRAISEDLSVYTGLS